MKPIFIFLLPVLAVSHTFGFYLVSFFVECFVAVIFYGGYELNILFSFSKMLDMAPHVDVAAALSIFPFTSYPLRSSHPMTTVHDINSILEFSNHVPVTPNHNCKPEPTYIVQTNSIGKSLNYF